MTTQVNNKPGLTFGYPKQVRLHFLHGFASLGVELGGLAGCRPLGGVSEHP